LRAQKINDTQTQIEKERLLTLWEQNETRGGEEERREKTRSLVGNRREREREE